MKRKGLAILCALALLCLMLTACGGSGGGSNSAGEATAATGSDMGGGYYFDVDEPASAPEADYSSGQESGSGNTRLQNAKMIYTANVEMETTDFQDCASGLEDLVGRLGGYMEYAEVNNYGSGYRRGSYTARIPSGNFESFLHSAGEIGHVTYQDKSGENISEMYYDTESRLTTQRTKLERLQALLAKAENMEDIITIESAIAETELAVEQLTGELRRYDALVDFATVRLSVQEVDRLSSVEQTPPTYASRLGTAFSEGWQNFTNGVKEFTFLLAYGWMWLLLLAVILLLVFRLRRRNRPWLKGLKKKNPPDEPKGPGGGVQ